MTQEESQELNLNPISKSIEEGRSRILTFKAKCEWMAGDERFNAAAIHTTPVAFDASAIPEEWPGDPLDKTIRDLQAIGFETISSEYKDVWGQGDGKWHHCVLQLENLRVESTKEGAFIIDVLSDGQPNL